VVKWNKNKPDDVSYSIRRLDPPNYTESEIQAIESADP